MEVILNLALKKDVFDGLKNGTTNQILIEKTNWWKKRLMDLDTGRFKKFDVACVSSGSSDKLNYDIENIDLKDNTFVISVKQEPVVIEPTVINPEPIEPVKVNPVTVETGENGEVIVKQTYVKPISEITQKILLNDILPDEEPEEEDEELEEPEVEETPEEVPEDKDIKKIVGNLFNKFCELKDVYVVNMPFVTIRTNGQILGCKKRLLADHENDVKFKFEIKKFIKYPNDSNSYFTLLVMSYINKLSKNNYVFVNKSASGFTENELGNITFTIVATAKKKYIFPKQ